jgi:hypothetical protein
MKNKFASTVYYLFNNYVIKLRIIITILGVTAISVVVIASDIKYYRYHKNYTSVRMNEVSDRLKELMTVDSAKGTLVSEDIPVNLMLPVLSKNTSLFVSSFSNYIEVEEIVNRLVLFAKIFNWDKQKFIDFMMPNPEYEMFYKKNDFVVNDQILQKGFGYWLVWHKRIMKADELKNYEAKIIDKFENIELRSLLKKFNVKKIQAFNKINVEVNVKSIFNGKDTKLYILE